MCSHQLSSVVACSAARTTHSCDQFLPLYMTSGREIMVDGSLKLKFCFIFHIFTCTGVPFGGKPKTKKKKNKNVCLESVEWKIQQKNTKQYVNIWSTKTTQCTSALNIMVLWKPWTLCTRTLKQKSFRCLTAKTKQKISPRLHMMLNDVLCVKWQKWNEQHLHEITDGLVHQLLGLEYYYGHCFARPLADVTEASWSKAEV